MVLGFSMEGFECGCNKPFIPSMAHCGCSMKIDSGRETILFIITESLVKSPVEVCKVMTCDQSQDILQSELTELGNRLAMVLER